MSCGMAKKMLKSRGLKAGREYSQTAAVREDTQNMEAGGDALGGVKIADDKTVKLQQVRVGGRVVRQRLGVFMVGKAGKAWKA